MVATALAFITTILLVSAALPAALQAQELYSPRSPKVEKATVVDLLLGIGGTLECQLKETGEQLADGATVTIWQGQKLIWKGTADQAGKLHPKNLNTGLYKIVYGDQSILCRAWTGETAPPHAKGALILNRDKTPGEHERFLPRLNLFPPIWSGTHDDPRLPTRP